MEEELIKYVRINPILYDFKNKEYRNQLARKEAWDEIGVKLGKSGILCKDTWNKLRNAYTNALNRRKTKSAEATKKMVKWIYEDQMKFLAPIVIPRQTRGNSRRISQNEIQKQEYDSNNEEIEAIEDKIQLYQPNNVNEPFSTDQPDIISPEYSSTFQQYLTPQKDLESKNINMENTVSELISIMKNNSCINSHHSQNQSSASQTCMHDEEEMFFLSLAKFFKKLNPAERIRVKSEVSQVVFQAEYRNLQNPEHYHQEYQFHNMASPTTSEKSFLSEKVIPNTEL